MAKAKTKKATKERTTYTRCSVPKCRRKAVKGPLCKPHAEEHEAAQFPVDTVVKVTPLEAAQFSALDAEIRNSLQGVRILDLEIEAAEKNIREVVTAHHAAQTVKRDNKNALRVAIDAKKIEYQEFVTALGTKYGMDASQMTIDTDTRTLRDLRGENQS